MKRLATGLLLLIGMQAGGQVLSGVVKAESEKKTLEPLPGASVYWENSDKGTFTDENGRFEIEILPNQNRLIIQAIGFLGDSLTYSGQSTVNVSLKRNVELIEEAVVEGETGTTKVSLIDPLNTQYMSERELTKAACCNLSESFETNASIDASFTDAVTGTRQIRMLGLDGKYTQMMQDVVPSIRGLSAISGLTFVPGPWVESIQVSKGVGSVSNGYESMTGQINVSMKNPENAEKFYLNAYGNQGGRTEFNIALNQRVSRRFATILQGHGQWNGQRMDQNKDGFMDNPLLTNFILRNAWKYRAINTGWEGEYQIQWLNQNRMSGQLDYRRDDEFSNPAQRLWGANLATTDLFAYAKTGYVWLNKPWKSFGSQLSFNRHDQEGNFGLRDYSGEQSSFRANLLYASNFKDEEHSFLTGVSYQFDEFEEVLDSLNFSRTESVPGAFFEYTWREAEIFTLVAGMRLDHHNLFGLFWSPRLHFRYSLAENTALKLSAGKGYRTSNAIQEHIGVLASNRQIIVNGAMSGAIPNLQPEQSWNYGINLTHKFLLNYRDASLTADFYRTDFIDQVVMDLENPREAQFYNLFGASWSNSAQIEMNWTPVRRWDLRLAYRWLDVKTRFSSGLLSKPLVSQHRAFANVAYETKPNERKGQWKFDLTGNWIGESRIPFTGVNPEAYVVAEQSDSYVLMHAQVTRVFSESFEFYLGGENLTNFRQPAPILAAEDPFGEYFDAGLIWGPVFGRMVYAGLRWKIK